MPGPHPSPGPVAGSSTAPAAPARPRLAMLLLLLVLLLSVAVLPAAPAAAGVNAWTPLTTAEGAAGGFGIDLQPDGSLDLEAAGTLYVSTDGGETWQRRVEPDFPPETGRYGRLPAEGLLQAGRDPAFQAGGPRLVLYQSDNGGRTWAPVERGVYEVVRPAWAGDAWYGTWFEWDRDASSCAGAAQAAAPSSRAVAGAPTSGPFSRDSYLVRSFDRGQTWERVHCGFAVQGVGWIPGAPDELLVRPETFVHSPAAPPGAWSGDGGRTWTGLDVLALELSTASGSGTGTAFLAFAEPGTGLEVAGLLRLVPGGPPYDRVFDGAVVQVAVDPTVPERWVLAAGDGRLYESRDDGRTWEVLADGPELAGLAGVAVTPEGRLVVSTGSGVLLKDAGASDWRSPQSPPPARVEVRVALTDPASPGRLHAWDDDHRLFRSVDGGQTWERFDQGLPALRDPVALDRAGGALFVVRAGDDLTTFRRDPGEAAWAEVSSVDRSTITGQRDTPCPAEGLSAHGYCSLDGGSTWSRVPQSVALVQTAGSGRRFRPAGPTGVETRPDGGGSWQRDLLGEVIDDLAADPHGDGALAMASGGALYQWQDGAWSERVRLPEGCGLSGSFSVAYHPVAADWRYVRGGECFAFSSDGGAGWWVESGLHARSPESGLLPDPHDPRRLYGGGGSLLLARAEPLLLGPEGRFRVTAAWTDFEGGTGPGHPRTVTGDTGAFWFFDQDNLELVLKVLDGGVLNQKYWVFYGALSNVGYEVTVFDLELGTSAHYTNPARVFASRGDTEALPRPPEEPAIFGPSSGFRLGAAAQASPLPLQEGRFEAKVEWEDFQGNAGVGTPRDLTGDTGYFWFFAEDNVEVVVKVLDARALDGHWWVFAGSLSNVAWRLTVTDTETGEERVYENPSGTFASFADTAAFAGP